MNSSGFDGAAAERLAAGHRSGGNGFRTARVPTPSWAERDDRPEPGATRSQSTGSVGERLTTLRVEPGP